ncbi:DUF433 domain-containing protein [Corynebacterium phoceense]|uniref:DUF433 domain-containing protein n=1 Tax=Corynebacterium phoceense TaxID=1686286 RepID=UPI00211CA94B|nr:DUF433 domain-containing protein [Corynebacterium phoceense]MCQ9331769.1 DUF433 domain-containing protein [Corynebacterium phoceense]MCQ9345823.1 DUF433 domain-containing protein [Corynebacterium phoceense]
MAYDTYMASYLSGATVDQLRHWARKKILVPEVNDHRPLLYSFRDIVALRAVAKLRAFTSLQRISKALKTLKDQDFTDHLSAYRFGFDGRSIKLWTDDELLDIDKNPGQFEMYTFEDIYKPFENFNHRLVPALLEPSPGITVNPSIMGGTPTVNGTRTSFDTLLNFTEDIESDEELEDVFPFLTMEDVKNARSFKTSLDELVA